MTKLAAGDVEKALLEQYEDYIWEEATYYLRAHDNALVIDDETYTVEVIDEYAGEEGDWSSLTYVILKVNGQLFRKLGRYQSHYGNDWEGPFAEVEPFERAVQDYREV